MRCAGEGLAKSTAFYTAASFVALLEASCAPSSGIC